MIDISRPKAARPGWPGELAVLLFFLVAYDRIVGLNAVDVPAAQERGQQLLDLESDWHLRVEPTLNSWLSGHHLLGQLLSVYYDFAHLTVAFAVGIWAWLAAPQVYRRARTTLVAVNAVAFTCFVLLPVAPPRLLASGAFTDVVARSGTWGSWTALDGVAAHAVEYASMPSLHLAWACWVLLTVRSVTQHRVLRLLALAHLLTTAMVVVTTGNHYVLDLPAGSLLALVCWRLTRPRPERLPAGGVLVVTASMGAGHDGVAYELARRWREQGTPVRVVDYLKVMPFGSGRLIKWVYGAQLAHAPATYEWLYKGIERHRFLDWATGFWAGWGRGRLLKQAKRDKVRLVLATYPLAGRALGQLRREQRLDLPAVTFLTDVDVHKSWLDRGTDLYLSVYGGSATEAERRTGRPARSTGPVLPPHHDRVLTEAERVVARASLGLEGVTAPVALLVTGSWGVGPVLGTATVLRDAGVLPVVLCGRNEALRAALEEVEGVRAIGWTNDVRTLYAAADVVVHNAGGLSSLEAMAAGVPVIGHGCLPGHGDRNARTMAEAGVAGYAADEDELVALVHEAVTDEGRAKAARARELFTADPVDVLRDIRVLPPVRSAARARRRVVAVAAAVPVLVGANLGVSQATELGLLAVDAPDRTAVYVAVRVPTDADAAFISTVSRAGVSALVSERTDLVEQRELTAAEVPLVAELPCRHGLRRHYRALLKAQETLTQVHLAGFVSTKGLTPITLAELEHDEVTSVVAKAVHGPADLDLKAGQQVVVEVAPGDVASTLAALSATAHASGLAVRPLSDVWPTT